MAKFKFLTREETGDEQVRQWCNLPADILTIILSHLFGKDFISMLSVCRSWRSAPPPPRSIPDPYFSEASRFPSLFHFSGNSPKCEFYDPFYNGSHVAQIPDKLIDARIYYSNYGWLLMCQASQLFFFHPFTNHRIALPSRSFLREYSRMCFSSPPTSPDCMVFGILDIDPGVILISIIRRGEDSWTDLCYKTKNVSFDPSQCNPVFYKGAFYCLSIDGKLGVFDPNKRGCRCWKIIDKLKHPCDSIQENFLVESNGELLSICMGSIGEYVKIFRLNYDYEIRWEEVHALGDKMIFACRTGCISMLTHTMGNTIYFQSFDNGGNGIFYSLASRKFHSLGLGLARKDLYDSKRLLHCAWITPITPEIYAEDDLRWFSNSENFIPSSGRVKVLGAPCTHPSFVFTGPENRQLVFNMFDSPCNSEQLTEVRQVVTATCAFGWLFQIYLDNSNCFLVNPQTMEKINLPQLPGSFNLCAISSSPNDSDCIVLLISTYCSEKEERIKFMYCRPGDSEWTIVTVLNELEELKSSSDESENSIDSDEEEEEEEEEEEVDQKTLIGGRISEIIGCQGKIYGLFCASALVKIYFDPIFKVKFVKRNKWDKVQLPLPSTLGSIHNKIYTVESCGELFVIRINFHGEAAADAIRMTDVEVFKLDIRSKVWEKVGSLCENIAFFCYDGRCCISSSSMEKGKGNCVYFISCFSDDENIYAFHFEDGSVSVCLSFPGVSMDSFGWTTLTLN